MFGKYYDRLYDALMEEFNDEEYVEELLTNEEITLYADYSMKDVAWEYIEQCMSFDQDTIQFMYNYLDIDAYVRDLMIDGNYIETEFGVIEVLG